MLSWSDRSVFAHWKRQIANANNSNNNAGEEIRNKDPINLANIHPQTVSVPAHDLVDNNLANNHPVLDPRAIAPIIEEEDEEGSLEDGVEG